MKSKPIRIQRKRTKGWRMPADTVYVGRGSAWGNPDKLPPDATLARRVLSVGYYGLAIDKWLAADPGHTLEPLRGKNLACWCRLDQVCHADVLLERANR